MSIIDKFKNIVTSNKDSICTKDNSSENLVYEYLNKVEHDLSIVKSEVETKATEEKRVKRLLNECNDEISKLERYLKRAQSDKDTSRESEFQDKIDELNFKKSKLSNEYTLLLNDFNKMKQIEEKLTSDFNNIKQKMNNIKNTLDNASSINDINVPIYNGESIKDSISKLEDEANEKLFNAKALEELNDLSNNKKDKEELDRLFDELENK